MLCMDCYSACPPVLSLLLVHLDALHPAPHGLITTAEAFPGLPKCRSQMFVQLHHDARARAGPGSSQDWLGGEVGEGSGSGVVGNAAKTPLL